jgi:hypothetical protein
MVLWSILVLDPREQSLAVSKAKCGVTRPFNACPKSLAHITSKSRCSPWAGVAMEMMMSEYGARMLRDENNQISSKEDK